MSLFVPSGGGGKRPFSVAVKAGSPQTRIWGVEPENFDDLRRSLIAGERVTNERVTVRSAMRSSRRNRAMLTFPVNKHNLAGGIAVTDNAVKAAMRDAANHLKHTVEPGGCVGLAALAAGEVDIEGKTVAVVLSGGNVDLDIYGELIAAA